jgi:hypothetical protein
MPTRARLPRIPMTPQELPQQRLHLVRALPVPPSAWSVALDEAAGTEAPASLPRSARYVGQVEWAWSPMNMRIDAYQLSMSRHHRAWVLWLRPFDDNWSRWDDAVPVASAPRCGLAARDAARLLMAAYWRRQADDGVDHFHWINGEGLLSAGDLKEIGRIAWRDDHADEDETP